MSNLNLKKAEIGRLLSDRARDVYAQSDMTFMVDRDGVYYVKDHPKSSDVTKIGSFEDVENYLLLFEEPDFSVGDRYVDPEGFWMVKEINPGTVTILCIGGTKMESNVGKIANIDTSEVDYYINGEGKEEWNPNGRFDNELYAIDID